MANIDKDPHPPPVNADPIPPEIQALHSTTNWMVDQYVNAGQVMGDGQTFLARFALDSFSVHHKLNPYYPFSTLVDWKMANFLLTSGLSMRAINTYLSLELSAKELRFRTEIRPSGPVWKFKVILTTHPTKQLVHLDYHDSLNCIESLFNNPIFAGEMEFSLYRLFTTAE
ncbi:hypothetical protein JVT61DRAFT_13314 [Boletus reticuloceps]|uniref:Uncharacterized protein n=1 Tax=Boletus reticuloceps TaxID=495285 RepID=A0A8I2YDG7_9AGAM|nr:hypothetical protein JVT61DRAFT_13314 [Boletus reticuloceps]